MLRIVPVPIFTMMAIAGSVCPCALAQERNVVVEASSIKQTWAVVIGIQQYQAAPRLACAGQDAKLFADTLSTIGHVSRQNILQVTDNTLLKPNCETLRRQIDVWLAKPGECDTLLFFFSGHGLWNPANGRMYLATTDTRLEDIEHSSLGIARLREQLGRCKASNKILILDCCHSGALKGESLDGEKLTKAFENVTGLVTLASCKGNQVSLEWKEKYQGLFSYWLIRGLHGEADLVPDGKIDVDELYRYVSEKVPQTALAEFGVKQTPVRSVLPDVEGVPVVLSLAGGVRAPAPPPAANPPPSARNPRVIHVVLEAPPETLGIRCSEVSDGLLIFGAPAGSVAEKAGLGYAQTITHVDGKEVTSLSELNDMLARARDRGSITITTHNHFGVVRTVELTWRPK